ncbi:unnamed protein product, partial [Bubo scandiacus]
ELQRRVNATDESTARLTWWPCWSFTYRKMNCPWKNWRGELRGWLGHGRWTRVLPSGVRDLLGLGKQ